MNIASVGEKFRARNCCHVADKAGLSADQLEKLALRATEKIFGKPDAENFAILRSAIDCDSRQLCFFGCTLPVKYWLLSLVCQSSGCNMSQL